MILLRSKVAKAGLAVVVVGAAVAAVVTMSLQHSWVHWAALEASWMQDKKLEARNNRGCFL
jgi:hypothetical protein